MTNSNTSAQIESKNLTILEDQLNKELHAYQKCTQYESSFTDSTLQNTVRTLAQHHQSNFNSLLNYLNSHQ